MKEKKIEDYLPLYLGCECISLRKKEFGALTLSAYLYYHIVFDKFKEWNSEEWKLILRNLSDMSEEEKNEVCEMGKYENFMEKIGNGTVTFGFEETRYLLSKCFDLFDLIESGLAINKSSLK